MPKQLPKKRTCKVSKQTKVISKPPTQLKRVSVPQTQALKSSSKLSIPQLCKNYEKRRDERFAEVRQIIQEITKKGQDNSFWVMDLQSAVQRINIWRHMLPRVELFYAEKTNPDIEICKIAVKMGTGFDVASTYEIERVMSLGAKAENCIFANPVKTKKQILVAKQHGIKKMTFDCVEELYKIAESFPEAECVLRIATDPSTAIYNLSEKYGAPMDDVPKILKTAKKLGIWVKGVAFHTGSGGVLFHSYEDALLNSRKIFDSAEKMGLKRMDLLDIGGGFSFIHPKTGKNFDEVAPQIGSLLDKVFPEKHIRIIAEPGRFVAESVGYLSSEIIGQKVLQSGDHHYYVNNGVYQGYCQSVQGEKQYCCPVDKSIEKRQKYKTTFWGQTCDSVDFILKDQMYPEYKTGEWIMTRDFGAYEKDLACRFNGFEFPNIIYI